MEIRVKKWTSIENKLERKNLEIESILLLRDLVGVRAILLFLTDLDKIDELIRSTFEVTSSENTADRLGEAQFGYQSLHYTIKVPLIWLEIPTMADFGDIQAEVQVRTLAQHIWAAASHKLQYKNEASVPPPIRRAINRASALLETIDLEFERILEKRREYRDIEILKGIDAAELNVDILESMLRDRFPEANRSDGEENYSELLENLTALSVHTAADFDTILKGKYAATMEEERTQLSIVDPETGYIGSSEERRRAGVYFTHVGLARVALAHHFGGEAILNVINKS
ncbi:MAG: hypothetical protein P8J00_01255 [Yoonia sp.]|nr:hypothetical protein [Yoonia sp.]